MGKNMKFLVSDETGALPRVAVASGALQEVPAAPLASHLSRLANSDGVGLLYTDEDTYTVRVSYAELEARTNALARAIAARARPTGANCDGDYVVAVCMQPTHNTVLTLLAAWKAGAAYVPMEPSFPQQRINHILEDAEPALVVYDDRCNPSMFALSGVPSVSFEELALESNGLSAESLKDLETLAVSCADSIAIVLYTSGSTGVPKGVRLPYSAICNRLWWQFRTFPFADTESICVWKTALTFGDSICEIWGPLLQGRTLLILSQETTRNPQKLIRALSENKVHRLVLVPTLLHTILMYFSLNRSERPLLQHLKLWVCSGEALDKKLAAQFFHYFGDHNGYKLGNFYGSTEVMGDVTFYVMENADQLDMHKTIPIGSPLDNCEVYLLDEEMQPVQESEVGEVCVAGANLAAGYVGGQATDKFCDNPHATSTDFGRLYRTGDFGMLQKGVILYAGRTDSQIKVRGHRVDLQEVERAVASVKGVDKTVVVSYGLTTSNPAILAFVTIEPSAKISGHDVETALKDALTNYMLPQVIVLDTIPLLYTGKVDRQALLKIYENIRNNDDSEQLDIDYTGVEPQDLEKAGVLFETVGTVIGRAARATISVRAGFYELGGNSLNSIYTITQLRDKGYYIEISYFLEAMNLGEVLSKMSTSPDCQSNDSKSKFTAEPMLDEHKRDVIDMIVLSFYEKADLGRYLRRKTKTRDFAQCVGPCYDYARCISTCWGALLQAGLSVVLRDDNGTPVAVALNFDARDEPEMQQCGGLARAIASLEASVRDSMLPEGKGTILHSFMMATAPHLSARDNVAAILELEHATMRMARDRHFHGVFATNTSPLTQQLGRDVLGFQTLLDYQINQLVDCQGNRMFREAPDDMRAIVCWKTVE